MELGLLRKIDEAGDEGITVQQLAQDSGVSEYGVGVLAEMALGMGVIKLNADAVKKNEEKCIMDVHVAALRRM